MSKVYQSSQRQTNKYGVRTDKIGKQERTFDGILFDSKKECRRYSELKILERRGDISGLEVQPEFLIEVNGIKVCKYIADFRYREKGKIIVEDVKGIRTPLYRIKKKLMAAVFGIEIKET